MSEINPDFKNNLQREAKGEEQYLSDLHGCGDLLQSAASRLAEFIHGLEEVPYEIRMAELEVKSAVELWTEVRRKFG